MEILVRFHARPNGVDLRAVGQLTRSVARETLTAAGASENCEVSVLYVRDDEMRRLNSDYRGIGRSTDVLAFAMREGEAMPGAAQNEMLGDVVISLDAAARQASVRGHSLRREVSVLLIHGALHLLGYDHVAPASGGRARPGVMRAMEERCMEALVSKMIV